MASETLSKKIRDDRIQLAERCLSVAKETLDDIHASKHEATVKDLIAIFNAAVKTHRDLVSDIQNMEEVETPSEKILAKNYTGKVDELLKRLDK